MTTEEQKKYSTLVEKTMQMRMCQKEYFKRRSGKMLALSKKLEKEVDQLLENEVDHVRQKLLF